MIKRGHGRQRLAKASQIPGFEASGCCAYSLHTALEQSDEDREWKGALSGCDFKTFDGVSED